MTGLELEALSADLHTFVPGRQVDDNVHIMLRFKGGAKGMLWACQVAPGNENGPSIRIYGDKGGIEWQQIEPNKMWFCPFGEPRQLLTRGGATPIGAEAPAGAEIRIPPGHPEGYLEAFATLYSDFAGVIRGGADNALLPTMADGVEGVQFIAAAIKSSKADGKWTGLGEV